MAYSIKKEPKHITVIRFLKPIARKYGWTLKYIASDLWLGEGVIELEPNYSHIQVSWDSISLVTMDGSGKMVFYPERRNLIGLVEDLNDIRK